MEKYRLYVCPVDSSLRLSALPSLLPLSPASFAGLGWRLETAFDLQCIQLSALLVQQYRLKVKATAQWDCIHAGESFAAEFAAAEAEVSRQFPTAAVQKFAYTETVEEFKRRVDSGVCSGVEDSVICVLPVEVMSRVAARLRRRDVPIMITQGRQVETCMEVSHLEFTYAEQGKSLWESANTLFFQPLFAGHMKKGISFDPTKGLLIDHNKPQSVLKSSAKALLVTLEPAVNAKLEELKRRPLFHAHLLASIVTLWSDLEQRLKNIMAEIETKDLETVSSSVLKLELRKQEVDSAKLFLPSQATCQSLQSALRTTQEDLQAWRQEIARAASAMQQEVAQTEARITALEGFLQAKLPQFSRISMRFREVHETSVELEISSSVEIAGAELVTAQAPDYVHICLPCLQIRKGVQVVSVPRGGNAPVQTYVVREGKKWLSSLVIVPASAYITPQ